MNVAPVNYSVVFLKSTRTRLFDVSVINLAASPSNQLFQVFFSEWRTEHWLLHPRVPDVPSLLGDVTTAKWAAVSPLECPHRPSTVSGELLYTGGQRWTLALICSTFPRFPAESGLSVKACAVTYFSFQLSLTGLSMCPALARRTCSLTLVFNTSSLVWTFFIFLLFSYISNLKHQRFLFISTLHTVVVCEELRLQGVFCKLPSILWAE